MRALLLSLLILGCKTESTETCGTAVPCAGGSYRACTTADGSACRLAASDGTSFPCAACNDCASATIKVQNWCSASDMGSGADLAGPLSQCGHPGDPVNSKGVGGFCTKISDCTGAANICSALGNGPTPSADDTYFCTIYPCTPDAGVNDNCGENASCVCSSGSGGPSGCACTPKSCQ